MNKVSNNTMIQISISVGEYEKLKKYLANMIDLLQNHEIMDGITISGKDLVDGLFYTTVKKGVMQRFDDYEVINGEIFKIER